MKPTIALISPEQTAYSTTFIKAHIDLLNAEVEHLHGIFFPTASVDGKYQLREPLLTSKVFHKLRLRHTYKGLFKDNPLAKYLRHENIQLVLAEFGPVGAEVCEACRQAEIPLIVHFHGYDAYVYHLLKSYAKAYQKMFAYASYLIVVSEEMKERIVALGAPQHKLVLNPYGPNSTFFATIPTFEQLNFIAVGRLVDKKAPHLTIRAFKKVHEQVPKAKLYIAGDGSLLEACQQLVKKISLEEAVVFLGATSHEQIIKLYQNAYCFVQHSVVAPNGDSEGTPVAVLEASAASLPVVATRHAGIKDVIIEGETGYLVDEGDVNSMAAYMIRLAQDKEEAQAMGKTGRKRVQEHYTMNKHIATINQLIQDSIYDYQR